MWATTNHNEDLVRVLLEHGASSSAKTARGHTAMSIAASSGLSSGGSSDTDGSLHRASESPSGIEAVAAGGDHKPGASSECASVKTDGDGFVVGSPRSTLTADHSAIGTPSRRAQARDPVSAGQNVLNMLQANRARPEGRSDLGDSGTAAQGGGGGLGIGLGAAGGRGGSSPAGDVTGALAGRLRGLAVDDDCIDGESDANDDDSDAAGDGGGSDKKQRQQQQQQPFDWDTLQLDQMYVISADTVPQFLHAVIKDIQPTQWLRATTAAEHRFVPASMVFLAARFAHHLGTPDFLESFLTDTIASIIHEVQTHKTDPVALAFWMSNIHTLLYFLKRDTTLVQATSDAQGRLSECMHDAYGLLFRAVERELEPLIDPALLAFESMPELFADVVFEAEKPQLSSQQRLGMFFFGGGAAAADSAAAARKSSDGRPLRRSQTVLQKGRSRRGSLLSAKAPAVTGAATASGEAPAWVLCVERLRGAGQPRTSNLGGAGVRQRPSSGDTFVSSRNSQDTPWPAMASGTGSSNALFGSPSPRTVTYFLDCLLDLLDMCEIHPLITWAVVRQVFSYLGSEAFNRVLTTREFCSRSCAMQIRMNLTQLNDWVRTNSRRLTPPQQQPKPASSLPGEESDGQALAQSAEALLHRQFFDPVVELLELLQCVSQLPDLAEYFETTAKMPGLNILQQETAVANYRYEANERRVAQDVVEYLESVAKEVRDGQRADREKQSLDKVSRRSTASVFGSERRTMDGRPSLFSFDMTSQRAGAGGLVRFSADPMASSDAGGFLAASERAVSIVSRDFAQGAGGGALPPASARLSSESGAEPAAQPSGGVRGVSRAASIRTGTAGRRGLLLPIARPSGSGSSKPSARSLFAAPSAPGTSGAALRLSESLEPISETSSVVSRQRSNTTVDAMEGTDEAASIVLSAGRLSGDVFALSSQTPPAAVPNTAPIGGGWARHEPQQQPPSVPGDCDDLSASLRGPKGKKCPLECMTELLDSSELLPFAVPTSREWLVWWQSHASGDSATAALRSHCRDWSNETVAYAIPAAATAAADAAATAADAPSLKSVDAGGAHSAGRHLLRPELAPVVPSEFLNALSEIA
ncbi:hypothetical protein GGI02_003405 [Coemansia sp. RSA 2322]|nr:hypothetical protein GGI02_003405 [Coemansia sp. RSA 2322]